MKKLILLLMSLLLSFQVMAHCGSCGAGGSADDHAEGEEVEHHDKDAKFQENAKMKEEMLDDEEESAEDDEDNDY